MAKLFLIRRNMENFAGPMPIAELKDAYKRMDFGLADEVSGHCGPWVLLEDVAALRKHYPDVARVMHAETFAGWAVGDAAPGGREGNEDTRRVPVARSKGFGLAITFLLIALLAFAAALYMAGQNRLSGKTREPSSNPLPEEAQGFLDRGDLGEFDSYISVNLDEIASRVSKQKKFELAWLPYLRNYAFAHEGQVAGIPAKLLRGTAAASAPTDCSLRAWRTRWRSSLKDWSGFVFEKKLVRAHWARILAWDPHWIGRREDKSWLGKQSFYSLCLTMASMAITEMTSDTSLVSVASDWDRLGIYKIKQRLQWILEVAVTGRSTVPSVLQADNPLSVWNCFEGAGDLKELARCREGLPTTNVEGDPWASYTEERYTWNALRIAAMGTGVLPEATQLFLANLPGKVNKGDHFTRFDYRAEQKLLRGLLVKLPQGSTDKPAPREPIEKHLERVRSEFPDVRIGL